MIASILIIEDSRHLQRDYVHMLGEEHEYHFAATAKQAIDLLDTRAFDHIICDFQLDQGTGRDVYDWLERKMPDELARLTFVCGTPAQVAGLSCPVYQKASFGLEEALRERVEETSG